ncbi:MAG: hypothetical protein H0U70_10845 [Tatlockia sp.]|nr:hypothetical protein [Tatlockia sp.]
MKKICIYFTTLIAFFFASVSSAAPGKFFEVRQVGSILSVTLNPLAPKRPYPLAGIKVNVETPNFKISNCQLDPFTGFCGFVASHSNPVLFNLVGTTGPLSISLCLNTKAPYTCQDYSIQFQMPTIPDRFAYIPNGNFISKCGISPTGDFVNCTTTTNGLAGPLGIALNPAETFAYVSNPLQVATAISKCSFTANRDLVNCSITGNNFILPSDIDINLEGTRAYILDSFLGGVSNCVIASDGELINCVKSPTGANLPTSLTLSPLGTHAYVINGDVYRCDIGFSGNLYNCVGSTPTLGGGAFAIAMNSTATLAYITTNTKVYKCQILASTGDLFGCVATANGFISARDILINATGTFAYVVDSAANNVSKCVINANGDLSACSIASTGFMAPVFLALSNI